MANFVLLYSGGGRPESEAEQAKVMNAWGAWFGGLGDAVVDHGNPMGPEARRISNGGSVSDGVGGSPLTGYSILKADSMEGAVKAAKGCPILLSGGEVTVYEVHPTM